MKLRTSLAAAFVVSLFTGSSFAQQAFVINGWQITIGNGWVQAQGTNGDDELEVSVSNGEVRISTDLSSFGWDLEIAAPSVTSIIVDARAGKDFISCNANVCFLFGGPGEDALIGGGGDDFLFGGDGPDGLYGKGGDDTLYGGPNGPDGRRDQLFGERGNDTLYGEEGDDELYGGPDRDVLYGGDGNDELYGGSGRDTLYGGNHADELYGGSGNDVLFGGAGVDVLAGDGGIDYLDGQGGDDYLYGGSRYFSIPFPGSPTPGFGEDYAPDTMIGGPGLDRFTFEALDLRVGNYGTPGNMSVSQKWWLGSQPGVHNAYDVRPPHDPRGTASPLRYWQCAG